MGWLAGAAVAGLLLATLAGCGGGDPGAAPSTAAAGAVTAPRPVIQLTSSVAAQGDAPTDTLDAARLAQQASFGATDDLIAEIAARGPAKWIAQQMTVTPSTYPALGSDATDRWMSVTQDWCSGNFTVGTVAHANCWRDYFTAVPVSWHFYRQAVHGKDQLRQRVAFALSQLFPINDMDVRGTYGLRDYQQLFRSYAFANYRTLLREVILSPVMGEFLDHVNNRKSSPNENLARELLQLFTVGTCQLNHNGTLKGGTCLPVYDNARVREYAYVLTGWTYPAGGRNYWCPEKCDGWANPRYMRGQLVALPDEHDTNRHVLLSNVAVAAGAAPLSALNTAIDSLMRHPNIGPFVARRLIQHLVTSNPSPAYIDAVATAFETGSYAGFGNGTRGDLAATVAAVLLNAEARDPAWITTPGYGRLREPAQIWTAVMRALDARTDGIWWNWVWGDEMRERPFAPPSIFNFYAPDTPVPGTAWVAPALALEDEVTSLQRDVLLWYANFGVGSDVLQNPANGVSSSTGTVVSHDRWLPQASDSKALVDRFDLILTSRQLTGAQKALMVEALDAINPSTYGSIWQAWRIRTAAYLVMMSPQFAIVR